MSDSGGRPAHMRCLSLRTLQRLVRRPDWRQTTGMEILNPQIEHAVRRELAADPRLSAPEEIAVEAFDGAVAVRGTVGSFAQRLAGLDGVTGITTEITVVQPR